MGESTIQNNEIQPVKENMKAAVINNWGGPEVFEIKNIPRPEIQDDQLLVKIHASSINPVDYKQRSGNHKYILGSPFPIVLGYDVCGEVVKIGSEIKEFKKGDLVFGDLDNKYGGALAEFAVGHEHCFAHQPENISIEAAAVSLAGLTALQALRDKGHIAENKTVLINGASGGVGHLAVQIAHIFKARVIAIASEKNSKFMEQYSPHEIVNYDKQDPLELDEKVDIFFDVAGKYSFVQCRRVLNRKGIYITTLPRPKVILHKLLQPFTHGKKVITLLRKHSFGDMRLLSEWMAKGYLKPHVDKVFNLEQVSDAHSFVEKGGFKGKVIVKIS